MSDHVGGDRRPGGHGRNGLSMIAAVMLGAIGLVSVAGGLWLAATGRDVPAWLVGLIASIAGWLAGLLTPAPRGPPW